jgi:cytochrome c-type biogenesis protein CcmF
MYGSILVVYALAVCLGAVVLYGIVSLRRSEKPAMIRAARILYLMSVASVLGVAAILLNLILTHQFQYTYVWSYSSRSLPLPLLISTFYAGQEGSFTLWLLYTSLIGVFLMRYTARTGYEPYVMSVYALIQSALLVMIVVKSPFVYAWQSWPDQIAPGFVPADGRGLNPLLQNYWMVIHPQVLFSGFSSMAVPYAFAVGALMKRDYDNWIRAATPWLAFAALVLGTGIMMGGFWAYETLGWGGYWGWDPVENSSLVPWLVSIASLHTILSQRRSGSYIRLNLVLGMLCFLFVCYSTFLTRSGVLGDTSVHSFVDPGMLVYWLLVGMLVLFGGIGAFFMIKRWKELPRPKAKHDYYSREFALFLGATALFVSAVLIAVGTSAPLITDILYGTKSAVDTSYYVKTNLPLGILMGLLAGLGQLLWWTRMDKRALLRSLLVPAAVSLVLTATVFSIAGITRPLAGVLVFAALFSLLVNVEVGLRIMKGNPKFAGGAVAHVGVAIMLMGFVASSVYDQKETVSLTQGKATSALGYSLTYKGYRPIEHDHFAFDVAVEKDGKSFTVAPIMFNSSYNEGLMRNPDIANLFVRDFYLAPLSLEQKSEEESGATKVTLHKGESTRLDSLQVTMTGFNLPDEQRTNMLEGKEARIGVQLEVRLAPYGVKKLEPAKIVGKGGPRDEPARLGEDYEFVIMAMHQEANSEMAVDLGIKNLRRSAMAAFEPDVLLAEASVKPFINLVWGGLIVLLVGFGVTIVRRTGEAKLARQA